MWQVNPVAIAVIAHVDFAEDAPRLEAKLAEAVFACKDSNPFDRLLILVPSSVLREHLVTRLVALQNKGAAPAVHHRAWLNVFILTFHQFCLRLLPKTDAPLWDDLACEEALRLLIQQTPGTAYADLSRTLGGCTALWQSVKDLYEADVEPEALYKAQQEGFLPKTMPIFDLYTCFREGVKERGIRTYTEDILWVYGAIERSDSREIAFDHIFYYGIYDLTQVHIDLLRTLSHRFTVSLFFPRVRKNPAWAFSERFYQRHLLGLMQPNTLNGRDTAETAPKFPGAHITVFSCSDIETEMQTLAQEILRLVENQGFSFDDIGLIARDGTPLETMATCLLRYGIPVSHAPKKALCALTYSQVVHLLTGQMLSASARERVALMASRYFRPVGLPMGLIDGPRCHAAIEHAVHRWEQNAQAIFPAVAPVEATDDEAVWIGILNQLNETLSGLPQTASWSDHADQWQQIFEIFLTPPTDASVEEVSVREATDAALAQMKMLDMLTDHVTQSDFVRAFHRRLAVTKIPVPSHASGVALMDAMTARGLHFRVLFLFRLNEGIFPRRICEDPFLPDTVRRAIETTLGNKLDEKQTGHDEERLLFTLLVHAARERLYCTYSRIDAKGAPCSPSVYLSELRQIAPNLVERPALSLEGITAGNDFNLFHPHELSVALGLLGTNIQPMLSPPAQVLYKRGRHALRLLNRRGRPSAYDGQIGAVAAPLLRRRGLSPSSMLRYRDCPFRFFAQEILGLYLSPPPHIAWTPLQIGEICHKILAAFYHAYSTGRTPSLIAIAQQIFAAPPYRSPYDIIQKIQQEQILHRLHVVILEDEKYRHASGFAPIQLERRCEGTLNGFPIRGRIDRIDQSENHYRVIDYKYSETEKPSQNHFLQLEIYRRLFSSLLAQSHDLQASIAVEAMLYHIRSNRPDDVLKIEPLIPKHTEVDGILSGITSGIETGQFAIRPGTYCHHCDMHAICRKDHRPSLQRASHAQTLQHKTRHAHSGKQTSSGEDA